LKKRGRTAGIPPAVRRLLGSAVLAVQLGEQQLRVHRPDEIAQRLRPGGDDVDGALDLHLARKAVQERADLLFDERLERLAVAERVVDREAQRLVVAPGPEARDRLDDLHVVAVVTAAVGGEHAYRD